jgi:hypothetical protein
MMSMMKTDNEVFEEWMTTILAIVPGVLITTAILLNVVYEMAFWAALALVFFVTIGWFYQSKKLPSWSLVAVGVLLTTVLIILSGIFGGIATFIVGSADVSLSIATIVVWLVILCIIFHFWSQKQFSFPPTIWLVTVSIIVCNFLVRIKYFYLFDLSWSVIGDVTRIALWSAAMLLLPVIIGMYLARWFGLTTVLFAVGTTFMWFQIIVDNAGRVSGNIHNPLLLAGYLMLTPVLATIVGPILYLRAKRAGYSLQGLLITTGVAVGANVVISGIVRGDFTIIIWLSAIPYIASVILVLWLSYLLYQATLAINLPANKSLNADPKSRAFY